MGVPSGLWITTLVVIGLVIVADFAVVARHPRAPPLREATLWILLYVGLAVLFHLGVLAFSGGRHAGEFFAGRVIEYSLSVENLFTFLLIMNRFAVPDRYRQKTLLIGIVPTLLLRRVFLAVGAEVVSRFTWVFYPFGAFLLYTAWKLLTGADEEFSENAALRAVRRIVPTTEDHHGSKLLVKVGNSRMVTPMLIVMVAIGTTDLLFAVDSIPAVFGLTKEPYLVFAVNAFALVGLRQLFFLIGGSLDRLIYLSEGLSAAWAFIGVKPILEALHDSGLIWVPEIPLALSLLVVTLTLVVTAVLSLLVSRKRADQQEADAEVEVG